MAQAQSRSAVLLIAHGSRRAEANDELVALAERLRARGLYEIVEWSYLEIAEPAIPNGARKCVDQGACRVLMLPFFLSAGNHVVEDLERHRRELDAEFPEVRFVLCSPLGSHPLMTEIVLARLTEGDTGPATPS
ncbi:MAG: sirohydrochlorin chelatase [Planctomycetaceae bacterium]